MTSIDQIKQLRKETGVPVIDCKKALKALEKVCANCDKRTGCSLTKGSDCAK